VVPVPLHRQRFATRGFDQAALLGVAVAERLGLPVLVDGLRRTRPTARQVGLTEVERDANVAGAFEVGDASFAGRPVVLLDDVFTTGATVREAARVLTRAQATRVDVLTLARASRERDLR
jgi:ComF family protein